MKFFAPKHVRILRSVLFLMGLVFLEVPVQAQVHYSGAGVYGMRKVVPTYSGSAITVRRSCDNATMNIGFNSCGDLDTTTIKTFAVASSPLAALSSTAAAAYSLRKLTCSATKAIQVRRTASGGGTQDIGFTTSGDLDTAALKTFVGSGNGFISIWYDQVNSNNATQTTAANQPQIVSSGVINRQNGLPAASFSAALTSYLNITYAATLNLATASTISTVFAKTGTPTGDATIFCQFYAPNNISSALSWNNNTGSYAPLSYGYFPTSVGAWQYSALSTDVSLNTNTIITGTILSGASNTSSINLYQNGTLISTASNKATVGANAAQPFLIGKRWDNNDYAPMNLQELIVFSSVLSATNRQFLEWSQSQYYSVSGPSLTSLPASPGSAYITTWFDQSGNSLNLSQATTSRQLAIVSSGVVAKLGTHAAALGSNASQTSLTGTFATAYTGSVLSTNTVMQTDANTTGNWRVVSIGNTALTSADWSTTQYFNINQRGNNTFVIERNSATGSTATVTIASPFILSSRFNATNHLLYNNGTATATVTDALAFNHNAMRVMGSINPSYEAGESLTGKMAEFSIFYAALNTTRRTLMETNQAVYHNITISNSKYTPPTTTSYNLFVNGIGRESTADSVSGTRSSAGMGFLSATGAGNYLQNDGDYIMAGMNCPVTAAVTSANLPASIQQRWNNDWYINKTDVGSNNGTITIYFDFSEYGMTGSPGAVGNYVLLGRSTSSGTFAVITVTSTAISGDRVQFTLDAASITNNNYYTIGTRNANTSTLPVELISFKCGLLNKTAAEITWATASEINNDHFEIERSADGTNYEYIGTIDGQLNSTQYHSYSFTDETALPGISYYRLKQVDNNTGFTYTAPCTLINGNGDDNILVYPSPATHTVTLDFSLSSKKRPDTFILMNSLGKPVTAPAVYTNDKITMDVTALENGIYFLELNTGKKLVKKIAVQK